MLAKGIEACVAIWTPEDYDACIAAALEGHATRSSPERRKLKRYFSANSLRTELDARRPRDGPAASCSSTPA